MSILKPCIVCGTLVPKPATRCEAHRLEQDNGRYKRRGKREHYDAEYRRKAAKVRATAIECWICGGSPQAGDVWTADHVIPGDPDSPLLPACRSCNARRGDAGRRKREQEQKPKPLF